MPGDQRFHATPGSHRLIETPEAGAEVLSLNTSAVYLGIAAGAAPGGRVMSDVGLGAPFPIGMYPVRSAPASVESIGTEGAGL